MPNYQLIKKIASLWRTKQENGAGIKMHVFLDRSVLEMYLNGYAITACFFASPDAVNIEIEGDRDHLESMDVWKMNSMWDR